MAQKHTLKSLSTLHLSTVRSRKFIYGLILGTLIVLSPYLFYLYRLPPPETQVWETTFFTIKAGPFYDVSYYLHALFTKIALVFFTSIAFLYIERWWKWSLLVPIVMFLYQLLSVINQNWIIFDEYSLYQSLKITIPLIAILIYFTLKLNNKKEKLDLLDMINQEVDDIKNRAAQ